jgi:hypothetical protein
MKISLTTAWLEQVKRGAAPGEDLKYDEGFTQLKNQNARFSPDSAWMLEKSAALSLRSLDWRLCMYSLHAAAIAGEPENLINAFSLLAFIATEKFNESYPSGNNQKIATISWCSSSYIVDHLKTHQENYTVDQLRHIQACMSQIYQAISRETGETIKWHSLDDFLSNQLKKSSTVPSIEVKTQLIEAETGQDFESAREARPFFDKFIATLLKEGQYERAISLSRAHRWCPLVVPKNQGNKAQIEIRQQAIDQIQHKFDRQDWEKVVLESELLFIHPNAHYFMRINYWSHAALTQMGEKQAAESIIISLRKLYNNYGQIFEFMYNSGQLFADPQTLDWIKLQCQEAQSFSAGSETRSVNEQWLLMDKDVVKMKAWIYEHPIKNNTDRFIHDYFHLKIIKTERADLPLSLPIHALFERSIDERLHAWEPDWALKIWTFYAEQLKDEKKLTKINHLSHWQAQWDHLTKTIARTHVPAALQLMKQA